MSSPVVLVTGGYDHRIRFWGASSGVRELTMLSPHHPSHACITFLVYAQKDCSRSIPFGDSQVNCVSVSADKGIVAGGGNALVHLFDVNGVE